MTARRPRILVLAGVNGAGKSSLIGAMLRDQGLRWFNPDTLSRQLVQRGWRKEQADAAAWNYGMRRLQRAIAERKDHAFETTLGGGTIVGLLREAALSHDVTVVYCGLATLEMHIARVRLRVSQGGHDIPVERMRQRWVSSRANLVSLMPHLARLQVFDNSTEVPVGDPIPDPVLLLEMSDGKLVFPDAEDAAALASLPRWAMPIAAAALRLRGEETPGRR